MRKLGVLLVVLVLGGGASAAAGSPAARSSCVSLGAPDPWQLRLGITEADYAGWCEDLVVRDYSPSAARSLCVDIGPPDPWQLRLGITETDFCRDSIVIEWSPPCSWGLPVPTCALDPIPLRAR